ncbi:MAG: hypothetical protein GY796_32730, partial [Chloroflexi bacterium]|nr:hypothetical protein [Chloroflexota bacterium]
MHLFGHLAVEGTITASVSITSPKFDIYVTPSGSLDVNFAILSGEANSSNNIGFYIQEGISNQPAILRNSTLQNFDKPIVTSPNNLHRLQMDNVAFNNNISNRIFIDIHSGTNSLGNDVTLIPQPGLEGYEVYDGYSHPNNLDLIVPPGVTLTMTAGSRLFLNDSGELQVEGQLNTSGTPQLPVTITTAVSNTTWSGILLDGGEAHLEYTEISHAATGISLTNAITNSLNISNSRIISASADGIAVDEGTVTAVCTTLSHNGRHGLNVFGSAPQINIHNSSFEQNGVSGLTNSSGTAVDARFNWWGDVSGPGGIGPGSG